MSHVSYRCVSFELKCPHTSLPTSSSSTCSPFSPNALLAPSAQHGKVRVRGEVMFVTNQCHKGGEWKWREWGSRTAKKQGNVSSFCTLRLSLEY
jgi:hypothetical protein